MAAQFHDVRVVDSGLTLELLLADGATGRVRAKDLRSKDLDVRPSPMPPWRLVDATLESGGVRLRTAGGRDWVLSEKYLAEAAGLVPMDERDLSADLLVVGADWAVTCAGEGGDAQSRLDVREDVGVAVRAGRIVAIGTSREILARFGKAPAGSGLVVPRIVDANGMGITPGLVDPHTHLVFAGDRSAEYAMRAEGAGYLEIAAAGGGIRSTMAATRAAGDEQLMGLAGGRLERMAGWGVTSLEAKTGYSLDRDGELRVLRIMQQLDALGALDISATVLSAHVVPPEYQDRRDEYVRLVIDEILPAVAAAGLARSCDVFCEQGAFTLEETRAILTKAKALGLGLRVHAEQFTDSGGAALAAELGAWSADHLEAAGDETVRAMSGSGTVAVLLPGAALTVGGRFPDGRKLIDAGVDVALGTDLNPGTSLTESIPLMMSLACTQMGMTVPEAWLAVTRNAAKAAGFEDRGALQVGLRADMALFDTPGPESIPYHLGRNLLAGSIKAGRQVKLA